MNYLPEKLQKYRKHFKYSQDYVAHVLNIDVVDYMGIENGRIMINYDQMLKLAKLYSVEVDEIFRNDANVTLKKIDGTTTDQININYFMKKKTFSYRLSEFIKKNLLYLIVGIVVVGGIVALLIINNKPKENPLIFNLGNKDKLAVSNTSVVYIDERGAVKGRGDNSNSQLSDLPSANVLKVCEGDTYTIALNNDGTISCLGAFKYSDELEELKDIVDIASGNRHAVLLDKNGKVYAFGNNDNGECEVSSFEDIKAIFAFNNATVAIKKDGQIKFCGDIFGTAMLSKYRNIIDIDASDNILVALQDNGKLIYTAKNDRYSIASSWDNLIDVCCGDEFIAGLNKNGEVLIAIDNVSIKENVDKWVKIKAISAGDEYLVGYDGEKIKGVGNNSYLQFEGETHSKEVLAKVSDVIVQTIDNTISVQFDSVEHASGYRVSLNVGIGISYDVKNNETVIFNSDNMEDGKTYIIEIIALGNEQYANSNPFKYYFDFERPKMPFYLDLDEYIGKNEEELINYLKELGINNYNKDNKDEEYCPEKEPYVLYIEYEKGEYDSYHKDEIEIKYGCCVLKDNEE